jgi:hypothetical protein
LGFFQDQWHAKQVNVTLGAWSLLCSSAGTSTQQEQTAR